MTARWRATRCGVAWISGVIIVEIECSTYHVTCPEHGVVTAVVPWAYPRSGFTRQSDMTVAWLAEYLPRGAVSRYMRIDWQTVGECVSRALRDLEPERGRRLDGLVNIGIDETSCRKGYKFVTVVVNHDTNTVVWVGDGKAVAVREARKVAAGIRGSVFALGKAPENLTDGQRTRLDIIRVGDLKLYRAYRLKESLRLLPETTDADQAETVLKHWLWWASRSRIPAAGELYVKIKRHKEHVPGAIRSGTGNARVEARNNKIKLITTGYTASGASGT